jgi:hypothetical protein
MNDTLKSSTAHDNRAHPATFARSASWRCSAR